MDKTRLMPLKIDEGVLQRLKNYLQRDTKDKKKEEKEEKDEKDKEKEEAEDKYIKLADLYKKIEGEAKYVLDSNIVSITWQQLLLL